MIALKKHILFLTFSGIAAIPLGMHISRGIAQSARDALRANTSALNLLTEYYDEHGFYPNQDQIKTWYWYDHTVPISIGRKLYVVLPIQLGHWKLEPRGGVEPNEIRLYLVVLENDKLKHRLVLHLRDGKVLPIASEVGKQDEP
jgi:hypothetical protein